ncbi:MAG: alanine racemase [Pseudomonadota bacterium]
MPASSPALSINLDALAANYRFFQSLAHRAQTAGVVKADGYGLGAEAVATALLNAGCQTFFVARVEEGAALRAFLDKIHADAGIYIFGGVLPGEEEAFLSARLKPVLNSIPQIEIWGAAARRQGRKLPAALHVDTGMTRFGLDAAGRRRLAQAPDLMAPIDVTYLMSHLACASDPTHPQNSVQLENFRAARALQPHAPASLSASAGAMLGNAYVFDLIRPGIGLYGAGPMDAPDARLKTVVTATAPIIQIRNAEAGAAVGYGATHTLARASRIAIVNVGYADGYLRAASNAAKVWLKGAEAPVAGRVSMDLIAIDVTDFAENALAPGEHVELFGPNMPVEDVAAASGSITYELFTSLGRRYARHYRYNASAWVPPGREDL